MVSKFKRPGFYSVSFLFMLIYYLYDDIICNNINNDILKTLNRKEEIMENNFEEVRKDIDLSSFDEDAKSFDRMKLELDSRYFNRMEAADSLYEKEYTLANNNDEELYRRTKIENVQKDHAKNIEKIFTDYCVELNECKEKYEPKTNPPYYFKMTYIGDVNKYKGLINGLSYFIKKYDDHIDVFSDVKFSSHLCKIPFDETEWKETLGFMEG